MEITTIVWMFMIGCAIATLTVYYNNRFLGRFVRALIDIDATSLENAISVEELGMKLTPALTRALRPNSSFSEIVIKTDDDKYYVSPDRISLAKAKFRSKDATFIFILMSLVIIALAGVALAYIFPESVESFKQSFNEIFA